MNVRIAARGVAIAVAVAAAIDPTWTTARWPNALRSKASPCARFRPTACNAPTFRLACKVRCGRCGFAWDCSEL